VLEMSWSSQTDDDPMALWPLSRLTTLTGYDVAPGEVDIRGWLVIADDGFRVGRIRDLVVDLDSLFVRYLEVELDRHLNSSVLSNRAIIPVACARVSAHRKHVNLRAITSRELAHAPRAKPQAMSPSDEALLRRFYLRENPPETSSSGNRDKAIADLQEQQQFWGMRRRGRTLQSYIRRRYS